MKIIAEIGSVHDGSFGNACKLIELAAQLGADIVKFQTHLPEAETLKNAPMPPYFKGEPRYEYFKRTGFSMEQWAELKTISERNGIEFISSPFSIEAVDLLESIGVKYYKIPSGEVTNTPMLEYIAKIGKPVILSSGMSNWDELDRAVEIFKGKVSLTVMQCTSAYPCKNEQVGLNILSEMRQRYGDSIQLGFSDHTVGIGAGIAATTLGAIMIEKHLTFSKKMYGSDAANALEPEEFKRYCLEIKDVFQMIHSPMDKDNISEFSEMKRIFEKSIVAKQSLAKGSEIKFESMAFKKPGDGIPAHKYRALIGRRLNMNVQIDHRFEWSDFQ